jgi:hypothetical protein
MFARKSLGSLYTTMAVTALSAGLSLSVNAQTIDYLSDVTRNVIDTNGRIVRGVVRSDGGIIDNSGHLIGKAAIGSITSSGDILDMSGKTVTRIYTVPTQTQVTTSSIIFTDSLSAVIDSRRDELNRMLSQSLKRSLLSSSQAGEYQLALQRIDSAEIAAKASGGGLTYDEAVDLARDLDSLSATIATTSSLPPLSPLVVVDPSGAVRFALAPNGYYRVLPASSQSTVSKTVSTTTTPTGRLITESTTVSPSSPQVQSVYSEKTIQTTQTVAP